MGNKDKKITKDTTIAETLKFPHAEEVLSKYRIGCMGCPMISFEKIEDIAKVHGVDLERLLFDIVMIEHSHARAVLLQLLKAVKWLNAQNVIKNFQYDLLIIKRAVLNLHALERFEKLADK